MRLAPTQNNFKRPPVLLQCRSWVLSVSWLVPLCDGTGLVVRSFLMMNNTELEKLVANVARDQNAHSVIMIVVNKHNRAEILCVDTTPPNSCSNPRKDLADILRNVADECESGGGVPVGNDGQIIP